MADASYTKLRARLDIMLRDADNFTFLPGEKDETLRAAIEDDPWVYTTIRDNSQAFVDGTRIYDSVFDEVVDVYLDLYGNGRIANLGASYWEVIDGELLIDPSADIPNGATIWVYGKQHLTKNDLIPQSLQAYVLHLAAAETCDMLVSGKVNRFLHNQATMSEIQISRQNHLQTADKLRRTLHNRRSIKF